MIAFDRWNDQHFLRTHGQKAKSPTHIMGGGGNASEHQKIKEQGKEKREQQGEIEKKQRKKGGKNQTRERKRRTKRKQGKRKGRKGTKKGKLEKGKKMKCMV